MKTTQANSTFTRTASGNKRKPVLNPAWVTFIRHCQELGFGEISNLKIQDGLPVMAEEITKKIKFS